MHKDYGRGIIERLFKKRTERPTVRHEFGTKVQADSDRCNIGVFEAGLSAKQHGDNVQSSGVAKKEWIEHCIVSIAKDNNLFVPKDNWAQFGDRKRVPSGESIVFLDTTESVVTKIRDPFAKAPIKNTQPEDILYEHLIHNILFPNTRYSFVGISCDLNGIKIILRQKYLFDGFSQCTQDMIDRYLVDGLGLKRENAYFYGNDYLAITDVYYDSDNVLCDGDNNLYFIDPLIKLKLPAVEVLDFLYSKCK